MAVAGLLVVAGTMASPARAAEPARVDTLRLAGPTRVMSAPEWDALNLGLAVDRWLQDDLRGAAQCLERVDITTASSNQDADRAAFLLAAAYLRLEDVDAFARVAARAGDGAGSAYRRWIAYAALLVAEGANTTHALPGAETLVAAWLLDSGRPRDALAVLAGEPPRGALASVHLYLRALAREACGEDPAPDWRRLAERKPGDALEADLVGAALLRLAQARLASGANATALLERVSGDSRHAARASHMLALSAIDAGDADAGYRRLEAVQRSHPTYEGRRQVKLALGGVAMAREHWHAALRYFESAEDNWLDAYASLAMLEMEAALPEVWDTWERQTAWRDEIRLAPQAALQAMDQLAETSLDLRLADTPRPPDGDDMRLWPRPAVRAEPPAWDSTGVLLRHRPRPEEWRALRALQRRRGHAESALAQQEWRIAELERERARRIDYLQRGRGRAAESADELAAAAGRMDGVLARLDGALAQLEAVRDRVLARIAVRTRAMTTELERDRLFVDAVRHFHVDGPRSDRPEIFPEGVPGPVELLTAETALAGEAQMALVRFAERAPDLINRSFDEIWEPRLAGDSRRLHAALLAELARALRLGASLDSTLAAVADDPALDAARNRRGSLAATADSLRANEVRLRRDIAGAVATRTRAQLADEREAIDYHLADAAYELAVQAAVDPVTAEDANVVAPLREWAIARLDTVLARYPQSPARGETRYRLADMRLMQARDDFRARMATFLGDAPSADDLQDRALAPFVDYEPAIALYQAILAEDPEFPHIDAVLFNLGMILSDDGRPEAGDYLERYVREFPDGADAQEAWLRMGNDRFDGKDYAGCVSYFEAAVAGSDPTFAAMALYKLGWARFEQDHFRESADAFRRLLDLYAAHAEVASAMDLREEAEEYLVHSLARAGGAEALRTYFDEIGGRDYEARILLSLGHLMRSVSLYEEAIACDALWLERYPDDAEALAVAQRLVAAYRSWNKPDDARAAKLAQAERFLPGGPWFAANADVELRASAQRFAQAAYREAAAHFHQRARHSDEAASWRSALDNYERYLTHWPSGAEAHRVHYLAGEAAGRLQRYPLSVAHFAAAAASDSAAFAADAAWQRVAMTDAWYRSSRPSETAVGSDSVAVVLLRAGRDFTARFADDVRAADIVWRQGHVAYAHGWYEQAAASFAMLGQRYPGDARAATAVRMSGDARYRLAEFDVAGAAYERAVSLARAAGQDSIVAAVEGTIPLCYYKHAESVAGADAKRGEEKAAPLFARVAERWPGFAHADLALYRAGLGYAAGGKVAEATASWERLLAEHPTSPYQRDAAIQVAQVHEKAGNIPAAAAAYERFSRLCADDPDAPAALLKAADLLSQARDESGAEEMRDLFLHRFPAEVETVMEIRSARAQKELAEIAAGGATLASALALSAGEGAAPRSELGAYLALANEHPELASPSILAQVAFLEAESAYPAYASMPLTQPLPAAIARKKASMEALVAKYERCAEYGIAEYARASAYRIGQALIAFGDALFASERPEGLDGEDLAAYETVLEEQSWAFYDRGEDFWSELLQQARDDGSDPGRWLARTREALWPRLAQRFLHRPELDYPLVAATPPERVKPLAKSN